MHLCSIGTFLQRQIKVRPAFRSQYMPQASTKTVLRYSLEQTVDDHIAQNPLCVFVKSYCGFSNKARQLLSGMVHPDSLHVIEIDKDPDMSAIQDYLQQLTGGRTVPRVFIGQKFVGGSDDIHALHDEGKLVRRSPAVVFTRCSVHAWCQHPAGAPVALSWLANAQATRGGVVGRSITHRRRCWRLRG